MGQSLCSAPRYRTLALLATAIAAAVPSPGPPAGHSSVPGALPGPPSHPIEHLPCSVEVITSILDIDSDKHVGVTITYAEQVSSGGDWGGAGEGNLPFPQNATGLPALCAVKVNVKSSGASTYNFGLFLPDETWNARFITTGNGGLGGGINWPDMGRFSKYGFASMSTDTGHNSRGFDGTWALNRPETMIDWGYRAMHGSVVIAKDIISGYYTGAQRGIRYSYYVSCSTGGRQGLKEVQLHPESFDGISIGAPAWWTTHLSGSTLRQGVINFPPSSPSSIAPSLMPVIRAEVLKQCDPQDGLSDGVISDPAGCNFDYGALLCSSGETSSCLNAQQLETLQRFYSDWIDEDQTFVFSGMSLGADPALLLGTPATIGWQFFQSWIYNDTNWDYTRISYSDVKFADTINPGSANADDFDAIGRYHERGGKILMYHGEADNLIPTRSSTYFYKQVENRLVPQGVRMDDFFRFFLVPGMAHCGQSSGDTGLLDGAPWYFAAGTQTLQPPGTYSVPGFEDADHDMVMALMRWVEGGKAPDQLIASKFKNDTAANGVISQRPLCVFPKQARYVGGKKELASSWVCKSLY